MYIFTRIRQAEPGTLPDALAFGVDIAQQVQQVTGTEVHTWNAVYGAPLGSLTWSCRADSLAELATMADKLNADSAYLDKLQESSGLFVGLAESRVAEVLFATGDVAPKRYTSIIQAQCAPGKIGEAMAWAVEAQTAVTKLTGQDGFVIRPLYGPFGSVAWLTPIETIEEVEAGQAAFKDPEFGAMIDAAGSLFLGGGTTSQLIQRLA